MNREESMRFDDFRIELECCQAQLELIARELRKAMEGTPMWDVFKDLIEATEFRSRRVEKLLQRR